MNRFEWTSAGAVAAAARLGPVTVAEAMATQSGAPGTAATVLKAGGIDLRDRMKEGLLTPRRIVNLRGIPELGRILEGADGSLRIGSLVTLAQIAEHPLVARRYRALAQAAGLPASPQIRNVATIGGNLLQRPHCWYFRSLHHHCLRKGGATCFAFSGENRYHAVFAHEGCAMVHPSTTAPALVALGARIELLRRDGSRRMVALESLFLTPEEDIRRENDLKPGEILAAIILPPMKPGVRSWYERQGEQDSFDWPVAEVAVVVKLDSPGICREAAVILGAAAPVPYRAKAAESALIGKPSSAGNARDAARAAVAGADPLSGNGYKLPVFEALVARAILHAANQG